MSSEQNEMRCPDCNAVLVVSGEAGDWQVRCPNCYKKKEAGSSVDAPAAETIFDNLFDHGAAEESKVESEKRPNADKEKPENQDASDPDKLPGFDKFEDIEDVDTRHPDNIPVDLDQFAKIPAPSTAPAKARAVAPDSAGATGARPVPPPPATNRPPASMPTSAPVPGSAADGELDDLQLEPIDVAPVSQPQDELLDVEGITDDSINVDDLYGIKCRICDTRIHVTEAQVGETIECPICYTKVLVTPRQKEHEMKTWVDPNAREKRDVRLQPGDDELTLEAPVQRPPTQTILDPNVGLPPVENDLLSPMFPAVPGDPQQGAATPPPQSARRQRADDGIPELEVLDDGGKAGGPAPPDGRAAGGRARHSVPPLVPPTPAGGADAQSSATARRRRFERQKNQQGDEVDNDPSTPAVEIHLPEDLEPKSLGQLHSETVNVFKDFGLWWRAAISVALIALGSIACSYYYEVVDLAEPGFGPAAMMVLYGLLYFIIGGAGTVMLWYICGYVFRDTARGAKKVRWSSAGFDEIKSSWLLFSFSFFIVWLPMAMFWTFISAPLEMLLAPPLLLGAWYNQSPFSCIAPGAFRNFRSDVAEWSNYYMYILIVAAITGFACFLFRIEFMNPIFSLVGAMIQTVATIAFAAVTGGHVGRVVARLKQ